MVVVTAGVVLASPIVIYTRWVDDPEPDPINPDGSFFQYCDWGVQGNANVYACVPNWRFGPELFDVTSLLPDAMGGIGTLDFNGDGNLEFLALTGLSANRQAAVAGEIRWFPGQTITEVRVPTLLGDRVELGTATNAVGFTVAPADADATPELILARTTTGADLVVDIFNRTGGPARASFPLSVPGMTIVAPRTPGSHFLGFTADDENGDGVAELMVLHTAPPGTNQVLVSIFAIDGTFVRTTSLALDPVAAAAAGSSFAETYVGGFARTAIQDGGPDEFVILTVEHTLGLHARAFPAMAFDLWRFNDGGTLLAGTPLLPVPFYSGAIVIGIAGLRASDDNCNGVDEDGDGMVDDGYVVKTVTCGVGSCQKTTSSSCIAGVETPPPACTPSDPTTEQLDGRDNDCNGLVDDILELPGCAAGSLDWWCCAQGGTLRFAVNAVSTPGGADVDLPPDSQAAMGCFPIGSGLTGTCNLRGVVRRAVQLRARSGVRPLCPVVAELAAGRHELSREGVGSFLVLGAGDLTVLGMGATPAAVVIAPRTSVPALRGRFMAAIPFENAAIVALAINNVTMSEGSTGDSGGALVAVGVEPAVTGLPRLVSVDIQRSIFAGNLSNQPGGAIAVENIKLAIRDSVFRNNRVDNFDITGGQTSRGGALFVSDSEAVIERSAFVGNAASKGGAITAFATQPLRAGRISILNSTIARNFCGQLGCAMELFNVDATVGFNTIVGNQLATNSPTTPRFAPGLYGLWDNDLAAEIRIFGNVIAANLDDGAFGLREGDGQSVDCHLELNPGVATFGASNNLVGSGGLDCALLGTPANDPLIGEGVPTNGLPNPADPVIDPLLEALPETAIGTCTEPGFNCQVVCPNATSAADCVLAPEPTSPAVGEGTPVTCPADDQRQYTRPAGQACSLGAYEYFGIPGASGQTAMSVLPRGGWVATSSSSAPGDAPANAIDGNSATRFSTGTPQTQGQWFSVDMQTPKVFSQITLDPAGSPGDFARQYQVFVSDDAVTWIGPVASGTGAAGVLTVAFPTQTARFVGVVQTGSSESWWSIGEFNVYGPGSVPTAPLGPTGWIVTASSSNGSETANRAIDGKLDTRWSSGRAQANGQSFQIDMLQPRTVARLVMNSGASSEDFARGYEVFATNDTINWGSPIATGVGTSAIVDVPFIQTTARFLKIVQTGSTSRWWSIAELTVYGLGSFLPAATALPRTGWTASASVSCGNEPPRNALDDHADTRFSTCQSQTPGQSFQLDMQTARVFSKITLDAGDSTGDYPRGFAVHVTNDLANWGAPIVTGDGVAQQTSITFANQTARYIKVVQTGLASKWWSIHELNVYGPPPAVLPRQGWTARASHNTATAAAGIDSNVSTRWTTGVPQANGQWYQLDLKAPQKFNQLTLEADGSSGDYPRRYEVFVSNNPANFGSAVATGMASAPLTSIGLPIQTARYIRVLQTGSSSKWWSIHEINVWAPPLF